MCSVLLLFKALQAWLVDLDTLFISSSVEIIVTAVLLGEKKFLWDHFYQALIINKRFYGFPCEVKLFSGDLDLFTFGSRILTTRLFCLQFGKLELTKLVIWPVERISGNQNIRSFILECFYMTSSLAPSSSSMFALNLPPCGFHLPWNLGATGDPWTLTLSTARRRGEGAGLYKSRGKVGWVMCDTSLPSPAYWAMPNLMFC